MLNEAHAPGADRILHDRTKVSGLAARPSCPARRAISNHIPPVTNTQLDRHGNPLGARRSRGNIRADLV